MGRELRFRGVDVMTSIWSARALIDAPQVVREVHRDFIDAGADIITINSYGIVKSNLAWAGIEDRFEALNLLACKLADEARDESGRSVVVAGSLPPLAGSYRPDRVGKFEEIEPLYREQAEVLAPHVDLLLCETMSSADEARAAAVAATQTGKPVWVSWTLHEDRSGRLRSGEPLEDALKALAELPVSGVLANCCAPESITRAVPWLAHAGLVYAGGYANTFQPIPEDWDLTGDKKSDGSLGLRTDLDPERYAAHAADWIEAGATVIGGCCGTRPAHIARLKQLIASKNR
ncbi:MAG: homocysteine S-methyltransferase family protein [Deltaproteobacteria bacterium]|nr:homocysteine S-methyltransferase family protein [Deltaproteobacteria bacterium]MBW2481611.1 homocysteine S-methyltransferase family protein [Deltaproteobacteria bacterium]